MVAATFGFAIATSGAHGPIHGAVQVPRPDTCGGCGAVLTLNGAVCDYCHRPNPLNTIPAFAIKGDFDAPR